MDKIRKMNLSYECQVKKAKICAKTCDIDNLYVNLETPMPKQMKIAMYLVHEFENDDFDFLRVLEKEDDLQREYEEYEKTEFSLLGEIGWKTGTVREKQKANGKQRKENLIDIAYGQGGSAEAKSSDKLGRKRTLSKKTQDKLS